MMNCYYGCQPHLPNKEDRWVPKFCDSDTMNLKWDCGANGMDIDLGSVVAPIIGTANDYALADNKPSINGVTLIGDKTNEELNIGAMSNMDIENILNSFI